MYILYIEKISRNKVRISLDNDEHFIIDEKQWNSFGIKTGDFIDEEFINKLYNEYFLVQAKRKALMLLKMRDHSKKELTDKLKLKGFPNSVVAQAVDYVISFRYIDDERYAQNYINFKGKNKSKKELFYELSMKGIDTYSLKEDEDIFEMHDDKETIRNILSKRVKCFEDLDLKEKERMTRYLARRGFAASDIFFVYNELGI